MSTEPKSIQKRKVLLIRADVTGWMSVKSLTYQFRVTKSLIGFKLYFTIHAATRFDQYDRGMLLRSIHTQFPDAVMTSGGQTEMTFTTHRSSAVKQKPLSQRFAKLSNDQDKWKLILRHKDDVVIHLDNDDTMIQFVSEGKWGHMDTYIGNSEGVFELLSVLKLTSSGV